MMRKESSSRKVPETARTRTGRPSSYRPEYASMAKQAAKLGATDAQLPRVFGVSDATIDNWKAQHPDLYGAFNVNLFSIALLLSHLTEVQSWTFRGELAVQHGSSRRILVFGGSM
jgi:hypothetical protein